MPSVTFIDHEGNEQVVEAEVGETLMEVANNNGVEGIVAECGGSCACGTCHCFIAAEWQSKMPEVSNLEKETIECAVEGTDDSRLSCQVTITADLDGMVVRLPEDQL